jgi:prepilin peptidase CpaA
VRNDEGSFRWSYLDEAMEFAIITMCGVATTTLLLAGAHDLAFRTVPNWMPMVLLLPGILLRLMSGTLILGLLAGLLIFLAGVFCWRRGWLGGGDVKLLAATAVLVPPSLVVNLLLDVALAGGVLAMIYLAMARLVALPSGTPRPSGMLQRIRRVELFRVRRGGPLPYASAIAAGTLFVLFKG